VDVARTRQLLANHLSLAELCVWSTVTEKGAIECKGRGELMLSEQAIPWMLAAAAVFLAMRCLVSLAGLLKERLQGLLTNHVKRCQIERRKRLRILELREKIRARKASAESERRAA
jgi:hypothetical protein